MSENWETGATTGFSTADVKFDLDEMKRLMKKLGPAPQKMYLINADPFLIGQPFSMPLPIFEDDFKFDLDRATTNFRVRTQLDYGVKIPDRRSFIKATDGCEGVRTNKLLRIACLAIAVALFILIWINSK